MCNGHITVGFLGARDFNYPEFLACEDCNPKKERYVMNEDIKDQLIQLQKEKLTDLEIRIARAVGKLTYFIESRERIPSDDMREIRSLLKGV